MGIIWEMVGADYSENAIDFSAPISEELLGWFYLNTDAGVAGQNLAFDSPYIGGMQGSPTYHDSYIEIAQGDTNSYLQTSIPDQDELTVIIVAASADTFSGTAHRPALAGAFGPNSDIGVGNLGTILYLGTDSTPPAANVRLQQIIGTSQSTAISAFSITTFTSFKFLALTISNSAGAIALYNKTDGTSTTASFTSGSRVLNDAMNWAAGRAQALLGSKKLAFAGWYGDAKAEADIDIIYPFLKDYLASRPTPITI